jgi:hypothetical protein
MRKSGRRGRRSASLVPVGQPQSLLERFTEAPQLERVVPQMAPAALHRVIRASGLEACGELVALATPEQLARVFDLDLWRADEPGDDERFDAGRFGTWLEVLLESGSALAARIVARLDVDLVVAGLSRHLRVFDLAATSYMSMDGEEIVAIRIGEEEQSCEVGGYRIVATRSDAWDAIVVILAALDADHADYFNRAMQGCVKLSSSTPEIDGMDSLLTVGDQAMFDLAVDRERRRDEEGYVTPAEARAFLELSRHVPRGDRNIPSPDPAVSLAGTSGPSARFARMRAQMQCVWERDPAAYSARTEELAFLVNTIVAGCSIQGRPFTVPEASDAAVAVCNLGLECWPDPAVSLAGGFLVAHTLITIFQTGWSVLYTDVCMDTAQRLVNVLARFRQADDETQAGLDELRVAMAAQCKAGRPWEARELLDVITILDIPAWATLRGLLDECPVLHAAAGASHARKISASSFEFISEAGQIKSIRAFMESLPDTLR